MTTGIEVYTLKPDFGDHKFMARDEDGLWFLFEGLPRIVSKNAYWANIDVPSSHMQFDDTVLKLPKEMVDLPWEQSLHKILPDGGLVRYWPPTHQELKQKINDRINRWLLGHGETAVLDRHTITVVAESFERIMKE
jgi:hypothetical protein